MEGHKYGYTVFESLWDTNIRSSKRTPVSSITVANIETNYQDEDVKIHFAQLTKFIDIQNNESFYKTIIKLINEEKLSPERFLVNDKKLLHKSMKEDYINPCMH